MYWRKLSPTVVSLGGGMELLRHGPLSEIPRSVELLPLEWVNRALMGPPSCHESESLSCFLLKDMISSFHTHPHHCNAILPGDPH
jgi:hypothetical protein